MISGTHFVLPNIRRCIIPDPGFTIFSVDLQGADAQVVAWEAEDEDLKEAFRKGLKIHAKNAEDLFGSRFTQAPGDIKNKSTAKGRLYDQCKRAIHATDYGASPDTLARTPEIAWTVRESEQFQRRWFSLHPGIKQWHERVENSLETNRSVTNRFGYRIVYFDRLRNVFPQALAWIPQSTVAEVTFQGAIQLEDRYDWVQLLIQVHDELVFQIPNTHLHRINELKLALRVIVPYPDPLIIPWGFSSSQKSWGDCQPLEEMKSVS